MADRYWVGGAGTWNATTTTNWSATSGGAGGASAPTSADNVIFNVNSNIGTGAFTVTITAATCKDFTASGLDGVMTVDSSATNAPLDVYGSMTLPITNLIWSPPIGITLTFRGTTSNTLTTNGVTVNTTNVTLDAVGGTLSLGSALTLNSTRSLTITNGTFTTTASNYALSTGGLSSSNSNVRSISLNASALTLTSATPLTFTTATNLTFSAGTSTITCSATSPTFAGGAQTFNNVTFSSTAVGTTAITGANTFNVLTQAAVATATFRTVSLAANQTIATLTLSSGASAVTRTFVASSSLGTQRTLTVATLTAISDVDFRDIVAAGASAASPWTGTRLGNCKNNSNITFGAGVNKYFSTVAGVSASWSGTAWATSSGGVPALNNFPLAQDTCIIDDSGATTGNGLRNGGVITIDVSWQMGTLNFSNRTVPFGWTQGNQDPVIYGNVTLTTAMTMITVTGTPSWTFANQGTVQAVDSAGVTIRLNNFSINSPGGGVSLTTNTTVDLSPIVAPNATGTVTLAAGTLTLNNNTLTTVFLNSSASTARTLAFGSTGKIVCKGTNTTVFSTSTATNLTVTGTNPLVQLTTNATTGSRGIIMGNAGETNAISVEITAGSDAIGFGTTTGSYKNISAVGFTGSLTFTNSIAIYGNFDVGGATAMTGTGDPQFLGASGTKTIRSNGLSFPDNISFSGVGATWTCLDALSVITTLTLTEGTLKLKAGTTNTVGAFATSGTNQKFLQSDTPGSQATLSDASGTDSVSYLTIQDSAATGGATWLAYVGNLNIDAGNNTGWVFFNNVYNRTVTDSATVTDVASVGVTFNAAISDLATLLDSTSSVLLWNLIDDSQTPNWQNIGNDQSPGWQDIDTI